MMVYLGNNVNKINFGFSTETDNEHDTNLAIYPQKNQHRKENDRPQLGQRHLS